jgi:hypothetical protein
VVRKGEGDHVMRLEITRARTHASAGVLRYELRYHWFRAEIRAKLGTDKPPEKERTHTYRHGCLLVCEARWSKGGS